MRRYVCATFCHWNSSLGSSSVTKTIPQNVVAAY